MNTSATTVCSSFCNEKRPFHFKNIHTNTLLLAIKDFNPNDHSFSFAVTCYHLLSFVITCFTTRCHSLSLEYHSSVFLSTILGKHLKSRGRHLHVLYKMNPLKEHDNIIFIIITLFCSWCTKLAYR